MEDKHQRLCWVSDRDEADLLAFSSLVVLSPLLPFYLFFFLMIIIFFHALIHRFTALHSFSLSGNTTFCSIQILNYFFSFFLHLILQISWKYTKTSKEMVKIPITIMFWAFKLQCLYCVERIIDDSASLTAWASWVSIILFLYSLPITLIAKYSFVFWRFSLFIITLFK